MGISHFSAACRRTAANPPVQYCSPSAPAMQSVRVARVPRLAATCTRATSQQQWLNVPSLLLQLANAYHTAGAARSAAATSCSHAPRRASALRPHRLPHTHNVASTHFATRQPPVRSFSIHQTDLDIGAHADDDNDDDVLLNTTVLSSDNRLTEARADIKQRLRSKQLASDLKAQTGCNRAEYRFARNKFYDSPQLQELTQHVAAYHDQNHAGSDAHSAELDAHIRETWETYLRAHVNQIDNAIAEPETTQTSADAKHVAQQMATPTPDGLLRRDWRGRIREDPILADLSDLSEPHEEFDLARSMGRKLIVHCGPTNSGKTYQAMQRLQQAESGIYLGPLRLLAFEVADKMSAQGIPTNLITGQERVETPGAQHVSSTIEMLNTQQIYDVAVIDEAQMIGERQRGGSWTTAILGVAAREVHICGDLSIVNMIREVAAVTGESLEIREYKRLTQLKLGTPLESWKDIQRGDCIVAFSRKTLYAIKQQIESHTNKKCCIIYGSLPPEARKVQASLFNDPNSGYDVLVASDAIGMGLNLRIGRVIFSTISKFDGIRERTLLATEVKQIGGRAGRFGSEFPVGYVTSLYSEDLPELRQLMTKPLPDTEKAGLEPSMQQMELFAHKKPLERLSSLYAYFAAYSQLDPLYFVVDLEEKMSIADAIQHVQLSIQDRYKWTLAPVSTKRSAQLAAFVKMAEAFATSDMVQISCLRPLRNLLKFQPKNERDVSELEHQWQIFDLYIWLALRFENRFADVEKATAIRDAISTHISQSLELLNLPNHKRAAVQRQLKARREKNESEAALSEEQRQDQHRLAVEYAIELAHSTTLDMDAKPVRRGRHASAR